MDDDGVLGRRRFDLSGAIDIDAFMEAEPGPTRQDSVSSSDDGAQSVEIISGAKAEQQLNWGLMAALVAATTALGIAIGLEAPPMLAAPLLLLLSAGAFALTEHWAPKPSTRYLGLVWAIIALRTLDGLILDLLAWGWLGEGTQASIFAMALLGALAVGNVAYSQRHDSDLIAAQATIILLLIATSAGSIGGPEATAIGIILATMVLHTLAYARDSGTLTTLGVAASNLWIGLHALVGGGHIFELSLVDLDDPMLLVGLLGTVNAINATAAYHLNGRSDWFGDIAERLGFNRPSVWALSIVLGIIGASMTILDQRASSDASFALLTVVLFAFTASYIEVKSPTPVRAGRVASMAAPGLVLLLIGDPFALTTPSTFRHLLSIIGALLVGLGMLLDEDASMRPLAALAILPTLLCVVALDGGRSLATVAIGATSTSILLLLRHGSLVSDEVLISAGLGITVLITFVTDMSDGGYVMVMLLGALFAGLGLVATHRASASIAALVMIGPWLWAIVFGLGIEDRLLGGAAALSPLDEQPLGLLLLAATILQAPVGWRAGRYEVVLPTPGALEELTQSMRRSGLLRVWTVGWVSALIGIAWTSATLTPVWGVTVISVAVIIHLVAQRSGSSTMTPVLLVAALGSLAILLVTRRGWDVLPLAIIIAAIPPSVGGFDMKASRIWTLSLAALAALLITAELFASASGNTSLHPITEVWVIVALVFGMVAYYLPRSSRLEQMIIPSSTMLILLLALMWYASEVKWGIVATTLGFIGAGAWLAGRGEVRLALHSIQKRSSLLEQHRAKMALIDSMPAEGNARLIDPELMTLLERKQGDSLTAEEAEALLLKDVSHRPIIVLALITAAGLAGLIQVWFAGTAGAPLILALTATSALLFVFLGRWSARRYDLPLPDVFGVELPVAWCGAILSLVFIAGRLSTASVVSASDPTLDYLTLMVALMGLAGAAAIGVDDVARRLRSAMLGMGVLLLCARLLASVFGRFPVPFSLDPRSGDAWFWEPEWLAVEALLLLCWFTLRTLYPVGREEGTRERSRRDTLMIRSLGLMALGAGPVGVVVATDVGVRSLRTRHPSGTALVSLLLLGSILAMTAWWARADAAFDEISLIFGAFAGLVVVWSVPNVRAAWTEPWIWSMHLLFIIGVFTSQTNFTRLGPLVFIFLSSITWITGLLQRRRMFRSFAIVDLLVAWGVAGLTAGSDIVVWLGLLVGTTALLGVVTWLNQTRADLFIDD